MTVKKPLIDKLTKEYGSPLYVFDKAEFVRNYLHFDRCMKSAYEKYHVAYSYKTNYAPYICKLIKQLGGYAEVVSDMEYYIAKKVGYRDDEIVYNGPVKGALGDRMLLGGGMLNIDNLEELERLVQLAKMNPDKHLSVGLRVNIDIGQTFISRFGIDAGSPDLARAIETIRSVENMTVQGVHCHVGQSRTVASWKNRVDRVLEIVDTYFKGQKLKYIDLGSGMYGEMDESLSRQFGENLPTFEQYAQAIGEAMNGYYQGWSYEDKPMLFTEPGTTIANHYIDFNGTVSSIKHIKGKAFVVLDCSKHNLGEIATLKQLPVRVIHNGRETECLKDANFVGYTCLEHDVMYHGYSGELAVGDYVAFGNVGGYSNVSKPPFICPNCPMLSVDGETVELIKRKETFDDVLITYEV